MHENVELEKSKENFSKSAIEEKQEVIADGTSETTTASQIREPQSDEEVKTMAKGEDIRN